MNRNLVKTAAITYLKYVAAIIIAVVGGVALFSAFLTIMLLPYVVAYFGWGIEPFPIGADENFTVQIAFIAWALFVIFPAFFAFIDWSENVE